MDGIAVAFIGAGATIVVGVLTLVGVIVTNKNANEKLNAEIHHHLETAQAVTDAKLDELTREVREHNGFARRMPVVEEQIRALTRRVENLEHHE